VMAIANTPSLNASMRVVRQPDRRATPGSSSVMDSSSLICVAVGAVARRRHRVPKLLMDSRDARDTHTDVDDRAAGQQRGVAAAGGHHRPP